MDKCSCGESEYSMVCYDLGSSEVAWNISVSYDSGCAKESYPVSFCPHCGDQLLPDGRVIRRESVPNRLMDMLKEVQATCPEAGLQEFALKCFNWIEEMREQAGLTQCELWNRSGLNDFPPFGNVDYPRWLCDAPKPVKLWQLFSLLNAAQKAKQEATK